VNGIDSDEPDNTDASRAGGDEFNRSLLRAIHEASPDGILVVDERAEVVAYNQRFVDIWRLPSHRLQPEPGEGSAIPDQPILLTVTQRVKDPEAFIERVQALYANPEANDHCEIALKDGRTIERVSKGLRGERGEYLGRVWFFRDISVHKQTERALRELAWRDPLTGLLNRRHFCERAVEELNRAQRYGHALAVLMLDLDYFKRVNDRYGHGAGDAVLETVGRRWKDALREMDILARFGGEEFAVLLPDTGLDGARLAAERLRASIAEQAVATDEGPVECTVSVGVSALRPDDRRIETLLHRADEALYRAKELGRDRVEVEP